MIIATRACLILGVGPHRRYLGDGVPQTASARVALTSLSVVSSGFTAQKMEDVVWNSRAAAVPHHILHQASAAGASKRS